MSQYLRVCSLLKFHVMVLFVLASAGAAVAGDWPMFRYDSGRSAASPHALPGELHLQWTHAYSPRKTVWDDPLNQDLMKYDRVFEPIVIGETLYVGFNDSDKVVALDTRSGREKWRVYVEGPVRFPPAADNGKVYFVSDDGFLYCVDGQSGDLVWKFRGGPTDQRLLGNARLVSTWPARGAPVLRDGSVYFTASIWPFMGTFIYALDAATGEVQWVNDGTGADYINQPHNYPAFASVAPQGVLVATEDKLVIPGGRSIPAVLDRATGKLEYFHLALYGQTGGAWAFANDSVFFGHERDDVYSMFDLQTGKAIKKDVGKQPVLSADGYYFGGSSVVKGTHKAPEKAVWELEVDAGGDLIRAGNRLYAGGNKVITVIQLPGGPGADADAGAARIVKTIAVDGDIKRLVAADDRLFAVTLDGRILSFGADEVSAPVVIRNEPIEKKLNPEFERIAAERLKPLDDRSGYALVYDVRDDDELEALARQSTFSIVGVSSDAKTVASLRRRLDDAGLYGRRVAVHVGDVGTFDTPPYMSSLTIASGADRSDTVERIFRSLRPFGGRALLGGDVQKTKRLIDNAALVDGQFELEGAVGVLSRPGALTGAGDWTHQYGNIRNTIKSDDQLVKLPLGVLWFGGNSNLDVLPRHGHGPPEQVIGGRLFIQGMNSLSARDVYTGRVMWKTQLNELDTFGVFFDETYKDTPLSKTYNQVHIPGANARGTNFIATEDKIYIIEGPMIRVLDTRDGTRVSSISLPNQSKDKADPIYGGENSSRNWGYMGVADDALIAGVGFSEFSSKLNMPHEKGEDTKSKWRFTDYDKTASAALVVMDRHTGAIRWRVEAAHGFLHNAITVMDGILYCMDKLPPNLEAKLKRLGKFEEQSSVLTAYDLQTGKRLWRTNENVFGTWLSCSQEHGIILQSTRPSSDTVREEDGKRMIAYEVKTGKVLWDKAIRYSTPPILHGTDIIAGGKKYSLLNGEVQHRINPLTGVQAEWEYISTKGCNYPIASENLITFRSSAAAFFDLTADGGTGHFGGFKSGCTSNLIAAGGVLNAPDYTRTCRCSYQNQTSLALVHMPDIEIWTHNDFEYDGNRVQRVGLNFGAPGDRRAENGTLWMDYPSVGGPSPNIGVEVDEGGRYFRHHASYVEGEQSWVAASGVEGAREIVVRLTPKPKNEAVFEVKINSGADDAEEKPNGTVGLTSSDLELVEDGTSQTIGLRFQEIPIARGAKIKSAAIQFYDDEVSKAPADLTITAEAAANAAEFKATAHNLSSRKRTGAASHWKPDAWPGKGVAGPAQRSSELADVLQEVVDGAGWKSGNAVAFLIEGSGRHVAKSYNGAKDKAARLQVELEAAPVAVEAQSPVKPYTVRLYFAEPNRNVSQGGRVFHVALQGDVVLKDFDIVAETAGQSRSVVKTFKSIMISNALAIRLDTVNGEQAVLSGVEIIAE